MKRSSIVLISLLLLSVVVSLKASRPDDTTAPYFSLMYSDANSNDGIAHLRWDISGFTEITQTVFVFQRSKDGIVWQDFAFLMGTNDSYNTLNDSIYACGDSIRYRGFAGVIDVTDTNWLGISDVITLFVKDNITPQGVSLNAISIDIDEHINFIWQKASSPDAKGYVIMRQSGQNLSKYLSVEGAEITSYIDTILDREEALSLEFKMQVFDNCGNESIYSLDGLFVSDAKVNYNGCQDNVSVSYSSAGASVLEPKELSLYGQRQDGTFDKIRTVPYNTNHNFTLSSVEAASYTAFKIETIGSTGTAFSYIDSFAILPPPVPNEFYITNVSVNDDGTVNVFTSLDHSIPFGSVELYRSIDNSASEEIVSWRKVVPDVWNDSKADASKANYSYFGIIDDSCGNKAHQSSVYTTMLLKGAIAGENIFRLSWGGYEGFDVAYYRIYMQEEIIDSVENAGSYDVKIPSLEEAYGTKFFIEVVSLDQITSRSNTVSLITSDLPDIFFPSGFAPDGITQIYKPIGRLGNLDEYDFRIYDKNGREVFRSKEVEVGWDGYVNGAALPDIYICKVRIRKGENVMERTATVTVVR
jgi:hypothetical protein